jgi:uncharacterized protein YodC (DUF2158 family)
MVDPLASTVLAGFYATMAQSKFKLGDVVKLKSGGPRMTITFVQPQNSDIPIRCTWFAHGVASEKISADDFPEEALEKDGER